MTNTENVRIDAKVLNKLRKHVAATKQTIGGFASLAIEEKLRDESIKTKIRKLFPESGFASNGDVSVAMNEVLKLVK